jgi:hypothetical protein
MENFCPEDDGWDYFRNVGNDQSVTAMRAVCLLRIIQRVCQTHTFIFLLCASSELLNQRLFTEKTATYKRCIQRVKKSIKCIFTRHDFVGMLLRIPPFTDTFYHSIASYT